jgi:hypothetical protein
LLKYAVILAGSTFVGRAKERMNFPYSRPTRDIPSRLARASDHLHTVHAARTSLSCRRHSMSVRAVTAAYARTITIMHIAPLTSHDLRSDGLAPGDRGTGGRIRLAYAVVS